MTLSARIVVRRSDLTIDVSLTAGDSEVVALLGPNGAGKTTCLRAIAGLQPIDAGEITVDGELVEAPGQAVRVPAAARRVGLVFQEHLLFPHLSARDNVAFGPRARGMSRSLARTSADTWLSRIDVAHLADRLPRQLSGGEAQRVALARALASEPRVLLLDEPMAAVDVGAKPALRAALRRHLRDFAGASVLVAHDPLDAMMLADRLVVLDHGGVVQHGSPVEVAARPRSAYVAQLAGLNLLRGQSSVGTVRVPPGIDVITASATSGEVFACFPPSAVGLHRDRPGGSPRNVWPAQVSALAPHGSAVRVQLDAGFPLLADVTPEALAAIDVIPGEQLWASVKATEISVYPA
jgi:molybdate transport system ATP-binding protein